MKESVPLEESASLKDLVQHEENNLLIECLCHDISLQLEGQIWQAMFYF